MRHSQLPLPPMLRPLGPRLVLSGTSAKRMLPHIAQTQKKKRISHGPLGDLTSTCTPDIHSPVFTCPRLKQPLQEASSALRSGTGLRNQSVSSAGTEHSNAQCPLAQLLPQHHCRSASGWLQVQCLSQIESGKTARTSLI